MAKVQSSPIREVMDIPDQDVPDQVRISDQESGTEPLIQADDAAIGLIYGLVMQMQGEKESPPAE
jgi:hypothetical protein